MCNSPIIHPEGEVYYYCSNPRCPERVARSIEYFVARGLATQWWGLHPAHNLRTERWVGEGLVTYMALRWLAFRDLCTSAAPR